MESTGKYWIPVHNILEPTCKIVLANPEYVKAPKGKKTDKHDAQWIADIFKPLLVQCANATIRSKVNPEISPPHND